MIADSGVVSGSPEDWTMTHDTSERVFGMTTIEISHERLYGKSTQTCHLSSTDTFPGASASAEVCAGQGACSRTTLMSEINKRD